MTTYLLIGLIVLIVIVVLVTIAVYNSTVRLKVQCDNALSQISVQLKRRYDLIPNLIETVKGYAAHEKEVFEKVTAARQVAMAGQNGSIEEIAKNESQLSGALKSLFAVAENYPDLKANQNFTALQEELATTENRIAFARQFYNDSVMKYNENIQVFPNSIIAGIFNFKTKNYIEIEQAETQPVKVQF